MPPYLATSQAYLEQSALLLQAYPDSRITTKYSYPSQHLSAQKKKAQSQRRHEQKRQQLSQSGNDPSSQSTPAPVQNDAQTTSAAPVASLTLKTYSPATGICLKYRTNKAAEVGRLITTLGKLAAGADVAGLGLSSTVPVGAGVGGDVEMADVPPAGDAAPGKADTAKGGKSKKKGGKGKR
ncbi:hypothetical protein LTS12_029649 [Elasticomyces elasticus]|nr:hypothetical protein LTS12_029649 [Elasticomyces elasticus]